MSKTKKIIIVIACLAVLLLGAFCFVFCSEKDDPSDDGDAALVHCCREYSAAFGNYGTFSITTLDENLEFETSFDHLENITLGGAFSGMTINAVTLDEENYHVTFAISGELSAGRYGTVEGEGIVKGQSILVEIPISTAFASTEDVVYDNVAEQQIEVELLMACFNKDVSVDDFVLSGALENMTVKSVSTEYAVDENGEDVLSQTAILTLSGNTNGTNYGYIEISDKATTYNEALKFSISTEFCGAVISNDQIDTYKLSDVIYIEAKNIGFLDTIKKEDITLEGALKDYAVIDEIDFVNEELIGIHLSFPYTFVGGQDMIGYIKLAPQTNTKQAELVCSSIVATPDVDFNMTVNNRTVNMTIELENEEFNPLGAHPFSVFTASGNEIPVLNLVIEKVEGHLNVSFHLPANHSGIMYFEIADAYSIVLQDGTDKNITIRSYFYI